MNRKAQSCHWDNPDRNKVHREKVLRKIQKLQGLRDLLSMWEERPDQVEHDYLVALRARVRSVENQFKAMQGDLELE